MKDTKPKACVAKVGGQALIEGILMKSPKHSAVVIRLPDNSIDQTVYENKSIKDKVPFFKLPVVRGAVNFIEAMIEGYKMLMMSAEKAFPEDEEVKTAAEKKKEGKAMQAASVLASGVGIIIAVMLMIVLPVWLVKFIDGFFPLGWTKTLLEGFIKILLFFLYIVAISQMKDIKRMFMYHGAEHKTIHCFEKGLPLTVENVKKMSRLHPRCGTSFMVFMVLVGVLIFSFVTWNNIWLRVILKLLVLPLTVGIGYELLRLCGKSDNLLTRIISAPGKFFQLFTTVEPTDDGILEVGILSLQAVLDKDGEIACKQ